MSATVTSAAVPFAPPALGSAEINEVVATLESGWLSTGPRVRRFEEAFAAYVGARHAIALNSCTAGLHLSLLAAGVRPGDEVITTPLTFCATANAIVHAGGRPVFADVDPSTGNLDPAAVVRAITPRTRAIVVVHHAGRPADVAAFRTLGRARGLTIVEDAAHCVEGVADGEKIGTTAAFTAFSFYATKNLTTGEGGMVTTDSPEAADWIRMASLHGMTRNAWGRYARTAPTDYDVLTAGFKYNMMDLQAAIGLHQLESLDDHHARRTAISDRYDRAFAQLPLGRLAGVPDGDVHARHLYQVLVDFRETGCTRDELAAQLAEAGVATSVHFRAVHLTSYYTNQFGYRRGDFPHAERLSDSLLSLPLSAGLTDAQVDQVIAAVCGQWGVSRHEA